MRLALSAFAAVLACIGPAPAGWTIAYAPGTNLERLDVAALGAARRSVDMAAYVLTDVPVIEALAEAGARGVHVRLYRQVEDFPPRGAAEAALARLAAAPNVEVRFKRGHALMHLKSYLVDGAGGRRGLPGSLRGGVEAIRRAWPVQP